MEWPENVDAGMLVAGLAFLLMGWVLYWVSLNVAGMVTAGGLALLAVELVLPHVELTELQAWGVRGVAAVVGAVAGVLLFRFIHRAGFFVLGAAAGTALGVAAHGLLPPDVDPSWLGTGLGKVMFGAVGTIVCGFGAVVFSRYVVIAATALSGAGMVAGSIGWPLDLLHAGPLVLFGLAVQLGVAKPWHRRARWEDEEE